MMSVSWPSPLKVSLGCGAGMKRYVTDVSDMSGSGGGLGHFSSVIYTRQRPSVSEKFLRMYEQS
jgi:hypothetical protein